MSISPQSRYIQGSVVRAPDSNGVYQVTVLRSIQPTGVNFGLYTWAANDRPDKVANNLLGNPSQWWAIFDINPELIDPLNVPAGTVIRYPQAPVMGQGTLTQ